MRRFIDVRVRRTACLVSLICAVVVPNDARSDGVDLLVFERAPYFVFEGNGSVAGLVASPTQAVFEKAGISYSWRKAAANRHLEIIAENNKPVCAPGWFKTPERAAVGKFTHSIYRDRQIVAIARRDNGIVRRYKKVSNLLASKMATFGHKLGFSYGSYLDGLISKREPHRVTTAEENAGMLRMLIAGKFDYMFLTVEEVSSLRARLGAAADKIATVVFDDMVPGNRRYIVCSRQVADETISKLNTAIKSVRQPH